MRAVLSSCRETAPSERRNSLVSVFAEFCACGQLDFWLLDLFQARIYCKCLFYLWFGGPPDLPFWSLGWSPVSRLGPAHPGSTWVPLRVTLTFFFPARQGLTPLGFSFWSCHVWETRLSVYRHFKCAGTRKWWHGPSRSCLGYH